VILRKKDKKQKEFKNLPHSAPLFALDLSMVCALVESFLKKIIIYSKSCKKSSSDFITLEMKKERRIPSCYFELFSCPAHNCILFRVFISLL